MHRIAFFARVPPPLIREEKKKNFGLKGVVPPFHSEKEAILCRSRIRQAK